MEPECHFFYKSWEYEQGLEYYTTKWFSEVGGEAAVGERSSSYLYGGARVAERIHRHLPDVKLIFTLRNPIERAWANYRFTVLQGLEDLDFMSALVQEQDRIVSASGQWAEIQPHDYTGRGMYGKNLETYLGYFPRENMLLIKSEEMGRNPQATFDQVANFLGIERRVLSIPPNYTALSVKDPVVQTGVRKQLGPKITPVIEAIRKEKPIEPYAQTDEDRRTIEMLRENLTTTKHDIPPEAKDFLAQFYAQDIDKLKRHVEFDLDDWR